MPVRPFPIPYSIGTDICHVPRIFKLLFPGHQLHSPLTSATSTSDINHRFISHLFTTYEIDLFREKLKLSATHNRQKLAEHVAGRWAAKEAVIKACGRQISFRDIVVLRLGTEAVILDSLPTVPSVEESDSGLARGPKLAVFDKIHPNSGVLSPIEDLSTTGLLSTKDEKATAELAPKTTTHQPKKPVDARTSKQFLDWEGQVCKISISHDGEYATATAIVCSDALVSKESTPDLKVGLLDPSDLSHNQ